MTLLVFVLILLVFWGLRTKLLQIKEIKLEGNSKLSAEEIIDASGIVTGENIIGTQGSDAEESVLDLPYVKDVNVKKKLPNTIFIQVQEREPYMQFEFNYSFAVVDLEGVLVDYSVRRDSGIPLVKGFNWEQLKPGEEIADYTIGEELQDFFYDEEIKNIVLKFREIVYDEENNIKIILFNGVTVEFGPLHNVEYKLKVLYEILQDVEEKNIPTKMIIMNKGDHPIVVKDEK